MLRVTPARRGFGGQMRVFWAEAIEKWVMIYGGRLPFVTPPGEETKSLAKSLTATQVFDTTAGIYVRYADSPEGPWSRKRTIFNPFDRETFGYCEIMYFADVLDEMAVAHRWHIVSLLRDECPLDNATRTAQGWWLDKTMILPDGDSESPQSLARRRFGAEYGAAVLPTFIDTAPGGGVRFHWLMSTWNPYRVVIMRTDLEPAPAVVP